MRQYHNQIKETVFLNGRYIFIWAIITYEDGTAKAKTIDGELETIIEIEFNHFTLTI